MTQSPQPSTEADLAQLTGTSTYYQHSLGVQYTDGVYYLAERGGAYWLIDAIRAPHRQANASWQIDPRVNRDPMLQQIQFWKLTVNDDQSALLVCERDEGDVAVSQDIPFTEFPLMRIRCMAPINVKMGYFS